MAAPPVALVLGAGPGLGASICKTCAGKGFRVAAGSRSGAKVASQVESVTSFAVDATDAASVEAFVDATEKQLGAITFAVFNAGAFVRSPILTLDPKEFERCWRVGTLGGFHLAQSVGRRMVARGHGTIIFTGATASLRGSANFVCLASPKFALRALAQSLAREVGPQGVHVSHVIVDGAVDLDSTRASYGPPAQEDGRLSSDAVAATYLAIHEQHRSAWTQELDVRPYCEKF